MADAVPSVRLIGFGEAAMAFAGDAAGPVWAVTSFDSKTDDPAAWAGKRADYDRLGVDGADTLADALAGGRIILSLVTAGQALAAAQAAADCIMPGALYLDGNSVAPDTKRAAASLITAAGGQYVDMAIMAPVHPTRRATPLLLSGPAADAAAAVLGALGFGRVTLMAGDVGAASSVKMIRSVMIKGMEALAAECAVAARRAGVLDEVLASLGPQWPADIAYRLERMTSHGRRRAEEMAEVAATLSALGVPPAMASGSQDWQQRLGSMQIDAALAPDARLAAIDAALGGAGRREKGCRMSRQPLIIDCHGHYTTAPVAHDAWREAQKAAFKAGMPTPAYPAISDDEIRETIEKNQLRLIRERGADMTIFSPRASAMAPHVGDQSVAVPWAQSCNDLIGRVVDLYPETFVGVCMLPQSPEADLASSIAELRRCVEQLGFIGCNLNPDPGGGHFRHPPLTDPYWFPLYEAMCELDVPAMIHVSGSCNPAMHATGAYYIAADTIAFMQLLEGDLFGRFPNLRFIIPHGGGAVPYHWGRYRGLADMLKKPALDSHLMDNVFFDTCVYHQPGVNLLAEVIDTKNILFGSEMVGAVRGIDPTTGQYFDDTKRYVDALPISDEARAAIFEGNARRVFPRLDQRLKERGL